MVYYIILYSFCRYIGGVSRGGSRQNRIPKGLEKLEHANRAVFYRPVELKKNKFYTDVRK